jgi:hypothetical protein
MTGALRAFFKRRGAVLLTLAILAVTAFHVGRMLKTELVVTGGGLSLPLDDSFIYLQYARHRSRASLRLHARQRPTTEPRASAIRSSSCRRSDSAIDGDRGRSPSGWRLRRERAPHRAFGRPSAGWIGGAPALALFLAARSFGAT